MSLINTEKTENNLYTLEFSVDKVKFDQAVNNAYRAQVKKINIPGFRPGKAPRHIIEKMYGKECFYEDAFNEVLPEAYENNRFRVRLPPFPKIRRSANRQKVRASNKNDLLHSI